MDLFRLDAMVDQFPFLIDILGSYDEDPTAIHVKRWDKHVLAHKPQEHRLVGSAVCEFGTDEWYVICGDKPLLFGEPEFLSRSLYAHEDPIHRVGKSLLESLLGLRDEHPSVLPAHLVNVVCEYSVRAQQPRHQTMEISVYKPARGASISELIEQTQAKAAAQVAAECDF